MANNMEQKKYADVRLGKLGAFMPMIVLVATIIGLSLTGRNGVNYLCGAGFLSLVSGWIIFKNPKEFQQAISKGLSAPTLVGIVPILLLSFILGKVLTASHMGEALLYWFTRFELPIGLLPLLCFALAALISVASGSSSAAILALLFVLAPLGFKLGFPAGLCSAAVVSGAVVGDNLAPISDSMVISSLSQEVPIPKVFRYRIKFSLIAFVISAVLYVVFGFIKAPAGSSEFSAISAEHAKSIVFVIVPVVMLTIMLKTSNIYNAMLSSEIVGIIMLVAMGMIQPGDIFSTDGVIISGMLSNLNIILFMMLLFIMISMITEAGCLDIVRDFLMKHSSGSVRRMEIICGLVSLFSASFMGSTPSALSFAGTISRNIMKPTRVSRARIASITGGITQGSVYVLPWASNAISVASYAIAAGAAAEGFTHFQMIPYNFFCIVLVLIYWFAILTGFGMKYDTDEELAEDNVPLNQ